VLLRDFATATARSVRRKVLVDWFARSNRVRATLRSRGFVDALLAECMAAFRAIAAKRFSTLPLSVGWICCCS